MKKKKKKQENIGIKIKRNKAKLVKLEFEKVKKREAKNGRENRATVDIYALEKRKNKWLKTQEGNDATVDNVDGGKCEVKRRAGEVMRSKLGPPRVANVPQIFGSKVRHEAPYDGTCTVL